MPVSKTERKNGFFGKDHITFAQIPTPGFWLINLPNSSPLRCSAIDINQSEEAEGSAKNALRKM
jgi:hypothetical protein